MDKGLLPYIKYKITGFTGIIPKKVNYGGEDVFIFDDYEFSVVDTGQDYIFHLYQVNTHYEHEWEIEKWPKEDVYDMIDDIFYDLYPI